MEEMMTKAGTPTEAVKHVIGMTNGFVQSIPNENLLAWSQRQSYLALANAINGAKALGFDSCPMEGFDPAAYSNTLKLPENIVPTALCPIGYAADEPRPKIRYAKEELFF